MCYTEQITKLKSEQGKEKIMIHLRIPYKFLALNWFKEEEYERPHAEKCSKPRIFICKL